MGEERTAKRLDVMMLDATNTFLMFVHPADARRFLKNREAVMVSKNPPAIKLRRTKESSELWRRSLMKKIESFTEFFREEKDIYVQNISGCIISLIFGSGKDQEYFSLKNIVDPIILTNHIPFAKVKESTDFRKMVTSDPPRLLILDKEGYDRYYEDKQKTGKKSAEELKRDAEKERTQFQNRTEKIDTKNPSPIHKVVQDGQRLGEKKIVQPLDIETEEEEVNPRILGICQKVSRQIPQAEWPDASTILAELKMVAETQKLCMDDFEHIRANVSYKGVRKWATGQQQELVASELPEIEALVSDEASVEA